MNFDIEIEIGKLIETIEHGEVIQSVEWHKRLANQLDDNRSEFYQAARSGLKPELTFEINDFEYSNENFVRYNGQQYTIVRASKQGDMRELVCSSQVGSEVNGA
ncbi:hypothetical protein HMI01_15150 [Halolactibacillus miurensis]|uniref:Phage head-tail adaptor, putative, SPP1 family n=1 Tax=Halolactibacillus miurensis TaxID=306541 RepID=A0A1I6RZE4_9BACI|nr:phage head closure protein [Halolactibacillus miurensis]GEM04527.1 hypothetical protein HMI01_15150 [Halolactibacillus miurensis]SFS70046.1 phage head-tail adaptor, putative, SPP1 family [Halolactibacillus miurensis]